MILNGETKRNEEHAGVAIEFPDAFALLFWTGPKAQNREDLPSFDHSVWILHQGQLRWRHDAQTCVGNYAPPRAAASPACFQTHALHPLADAGLLARVGVKCCCG